MTVKLTNLGLPRGAVHPAQQDRRRGRKPAVFFAGLSLARGKKDFAAPIFPIFFFLQLEQYLASVPAITLARRSLLPIACDQRRHPGAAAIGRGRTVSRPAAGSLPDSGFAFPVFAPLRETRGLTPAKTLPKALVSAVPIENHGDGRGLPKRLVGSATCTLARSDMACR